MHLRSSGIAPTGRGLKTEAFADASAGRDPGGEALGRGDACRARESKLRAAPPTALSDFRQLRRAAARSRSPAPTPGWFQAESRKNGAD